MSSWSQKCEGDVLSREVAMCAFQQDRKESSGVGREGFTAQFGLRNGIYLGPIGSRRVQAEKDGWQRGNWQHEPWVAQLNMLPRLVGLQRRSEGGGGAAQRALEVLIDLRERVKGREARLRGMHLSSRGREVARGLNTHHLPVDDVPEGSNVLGPPVLVLEVVGVLRSRRACRGRSRVRSPDRATACCPSLFSSRTARSPPRHPGPARGSSARQPGA
jgi:hypothetical protein